jgi:hypothetical protein
MTLQQMKLVMGDDGDDIYIRSIGALYAVALWAEGAPEKNMDIPDHEVGDLLLFIGMPWVSSGLMADSLGNYTSVIAGWTSDIHVAKRIATGDSSDNYTVPAGGVGNLHSIRTGQIIAIASRSGVPTFAQNNGIATNGGDGGNFKMAARTIGGIDENILSIGLMHGHNGGFPPPKTMTFEYASTIVNAGDKVSQHDLEVSSQRYQFAGWGWEYRAAASTTSLVEITANPSEFAKSYRTGWMTFYSV